MPSNILMTIFLCMRLPGWLLWQPGIAIHIIARQAVMLHQFEKKCDLPFRISTQFSYFLLDYELDNVKADRLRSFVDLLQD